LVRAQLAGGAARGAYAWWRRDANNLGADPQQKRGWPLANERAPVAFAASQGVADAALEAIAAQYQADWTILSVIVKYSLCAVSTREVVRGVLL
jgi:hypothetical protein